MAITSADLLSSIKSVLQFIAMCINFFRENNPRKWRVGVEKQDLVVDWKLNRAFSKFND